MRLRIGIASLAALAALFVMAIAAGPASAGNGFENPRNQADVPLEDTNYLGAYCADPSGPPVVDQNTGEYARPGGSADVGNTDAMPEPQATNIPYLAWRGEEIRLVKCLRDYNAEPGQIAQTLEDNENLFIGNWTLERWSGVHDGDRPRFEGPDATEEQAQAWPFEGSVEGVPALCWAAHVVSAESGLGMFKLTINLSSFRNPCTVQPEQEEGEEQEQDEPFCPRFTLNDIQVLKHQVLVGWMTLNAPALCEVNKGGDATTGATVANRAAACGPANQGTGQFPAGSKAGEIQVLVTGTLTLAQQFGRDIVASAAAAGAGAFTGTNPGHGAAAGALMPADWPTLAAALARSAQLQREAEADLWDIHDDNAPTEGHVNAVFCEQDNIDTNGNGIPESPSGVDQRSDVDAVDNCIVFNEEPDLEVMSRYYGDITFPFTLGPHDPLRPNTSLLTDGKLDAFDAPMPPARVDVSITGGFGSLETDRAANQLPGVYKGVDKHVVYSRDGTGADTPHNLYAPYYAACIPARACEYATQFEYIASGSDSALINNNFVGYLTFGTGEQIGNTGVSGFGVYHYWDAFVLVDRLSTATACRAAEDEAGAVRTNKGFFQRTAQGPTTVAVYSDEHGEARVGFLPGVGFNPASVGVTVNSNGGCDLQGVNPVATTTVSAVARYPYQPTGAPDARGANTLAKALLSRWNKMVQCFPKGDGSNDKVICVAHADDVTGSPISGEQVCAIVETGSVLHYPETGSFGDIHNVGAFPHGASTSTSYPGNHGNFRHAAAGHQDLRVFNAGGRTTEGSSRACADTDGQGNVAFVIVNPRRAGQQDFAAFLFMEQGIQRCVSFVYGVGGGPSTRPDCNVNNGGPGGTGTGTGTGTGSVVINHGPLVPRPDAQPGTTQNPQSGSTTTKPETKPAVLKRATIASAKIVTTKKGRYLVFRVKPSQANQTTARVQIRLIGRNGKVVGTVVRTVRTNYTVRLRLAKTARTVRLSVLA